MRHFRTWKIGFAFIAALFAITAAAEVPWVTQGPKRTIQTLIIAANYKSPRLMAELILYESRQPYLLFPVPESGDTRIYFCPAKGPSLEIPAGQLNTYVNFLHPRRIVVLGDQKYVSDQALATLDRSIPIVRIEGNDWKRIAEELTFMLNLSNLADDFKEKREEMDRSYKPISRPMQLKPAKPADSVENKEEIPAGTAEESAEQTDSTVQELPVEAN